MIKKITIGITLLLLTVQCNSSKIISINSEVGIIKATSTSIQIKRQEGTRLNFTILAYKEISNLSVYYWEKESDLNIIKQNGDTIWAQADIIKPIRGRSAGESTESQEMVRPIDTTCVFMYRYNEETVKLKIPKLSSEKN